MTAFASMQAPALINPLGPPLEELPISDLQEMRPRSAKEAFRLVDELEAGHRSPRHEQFLTCRLDAIADLINEIDCITKGL